MQLRGLRDTSLTRHKGYSNENDSFCIEYPLCVLALIKNKTYISSYKIKRLEPRSFEYLLMRLNKYSLKIWNTKMKTLIEIPAAIFTESGTLIWRVIEILMLVWKCKSKREERRKSRRDKIKKYN